MAKPVSASQVKLCLPTQKGFLIVQLNEVLYCEAQGNHTIFRLLLNRSLLVTRPLFDYEQLLSGTTFLRIHRSFLINILHVRQYLRGEGGSVVMADGSELEISRAKKEFFIQNLRQLLTY